VYTIFLNFISLEITAFTLPTCIVLAILAGIGVDQTLKACGSMINVGGGTQRLIKAACCMAPAIPLFLNYGINDQSRNYTAYEQAVNIFRTTNNGDIIFMNGDNYIFPIIYGRLVEKMREDIRLYDRNNIFFNWLKEDHNILPNRSAFEDLRTRMEQKIIKERGNRNVFYAVFGPYAIKLPDQYIMVNYGVLHRVVHKEDMIKTYEFSNVWNYYSSESFYEEFQRDFMTRELCAYFYFNRGIYLFLTGQRSYGLKNLKLASIIGYDDTLIHMDMAIFLIDEGFFEEGRQELEKALLYHEDLSKVYNNWGYYYHKIGRYGASIVSLRKAIDLSPDDFSCYNNLGYAFYKAGKKEDAFRTFQQSLSINGDQPEIEEFMDKNGLKEGVVN